MPDGNRPPLPTRRTLLAGVGTTFMLPRLGWGQVQQTRLGLSLRLQESTLPLRPGQTETSAWRFQPDWRGLDRPLREGGTLDLDLTNALPIPVNLNWHGLDGVAAVEPVLAQGAVAAGQSLARSIRFGSAGTYFVDTRLGNDGAARPLPCGAFAVQETSPPQVDRDEILLIEDWRLKADGTALPPGQDPTDATTVYTVNGQLDWNIPVHTNQRLRLRFINGCHRAAIALRIDGHEVGVIAIDGRPAEPFPARDGRLIFAPGTRIDVLIDATNAPQGVSPIHLHDGTAPRPIATLTYTSEPPVRDAPLPLPAPLASSGLPARIPLQGAQRFELGIGAATGDADWVAADRFSTSLAPAFRARAGRAVVLAITNRAAMPVTFHLHGHHFRLLDRLDDGWKPFWLDTLLFDAGQTQRIAFLAEHQGAWLMEAMGIDWSAPRRVRWFAVS